MGLSAGAGSPAYFQCWKCRRSKAWSSRVDPAGWRKGLAQRVKLTGRTKTHASGRGHALGSRNTHTSYEYTCPDCGHTGWSSHIDLKRQADRA